MPAQHSSETGGLCSAEGELWSLASLCRKTHTAALGSEPWFKSITKGQYRQIFILFRSYLINKNTTPTLKSAFMLSSCFLTDVHQSYLPWGQRFFPVKSTNQSSLDSDRPSADTGAHGHICSCHVWLQGHSVPTVARKDSKHQSPLGGEGSGHGRCLSWRRILEKLYILQRA